MGNGSEVTEKHCKSATVGREDETTQNQEDGSDMGGLWGIMEEGRESLRRPCLGRSRVPRGSPGTWMLQLLR